MVYFLDLLYSQLLVKIPEQNADFTNQTVIVTGSNTGLGLEAARLLIRLNASKVILAVRTISKGEAAAKSITTSCNVPAPRVEVWQLDMSNKDSIVAFVKRAATLDRLDAAILNAGVFNFKRNDIDGIEAHLAVNVIGATLLELLLLPVLQKSAAHTGLRGRLTLVGSDMMYTVNPADFQTSGAIFPYLNTPGVLAEGNYYAYSKWLVYQASRRIADSHPLSKDSNVIINVQTPGACKSDLFREEGTALSKAVSWVMFALFARTTETGARTLVHAISPELKEEAHGAFLMDAKVQE
jgi:NAD(P)-dependent dehydrogenase (short-subunit alcohol dehydrogenase family)